MPRAARLAAALEDGLGQKAQLIAGEDGIFDVAVDGVVVFSKQDRGDFIPTPEIVKLVKARLEKM
ncbi:Rdx family protein [Candidatus Zixiibacteriota bacterium]